MTITVHMRKHLIAGKPAKALLISKNIDLIREDDDGCVVCINGYWHALTDKLNDIQQRLKGR